MNHYKLNLPINPLKEGFVPKIVSEYVKMGEYSQHISWNIHEDYRKVLNNETIDILKSLDLEPLFSIVFGSEKHSRDNGLIHADIGWNNTQWKEIPCAINWELTPGNTEYSWYNVEECNGLWPLKTADEHPYPLNLLNGLVYVNNWMDFDVATSANPGKTKVEETVIVSQEQGPILFNSGKAHSANYKTPGNSRTMLSIRFGLDKIKSWEQAVEIFKPLIIGD